MLLAQGYNRHEYCALRVVAGEHEGFSEIRFTFLVIARFIRAIQFPLSEKNWIARIKRAMTKKGRLKFL
jgi:hypothetical protein